MTDQERLARLAVRMMEAKASGRVARWDHLRRLPNGTVREVDCKGCGLLIRRLSTFRNAERQVIQVCQPLQAYTEMVYEFTQGGKHVTHCCRACAVRPWPLDTLQAFFLCDVAARLDRPGALEDPALVPLFAAQADRIVSGWRRPRHDSESPHRGGDPVAEMAHAG